MSSAISWPFSPFRDDLLKGSSRFLFIALFIPCALQAQEKTPAPLEVFDPSKVEPKKVVLDFFQVAKGLLITVRAESSQWFNPTNFDFCSNDGQRNRRADRRPDQDIQTAQWRQEDPDSTLAGTPSGGC